MPYNRPTLKTIYARIVADLETRINNRSIARGQGFLQVKLLKFSLIGILAIVFAGVAHMLYGYISYLSRQLLPDIAEDEWLERHAKLRGLTKTAATYTTGKVNFTGTSSTMIEVGTVLQSESGIQFATTEEAIIIDGFSNNIAVRAVVAGSSGNITDVELRLVSPITGVDSTVTVSGGFDDGIDQETVEELRARYLLLLRKPPTGGRDDDYKRWALEVAGISFAWVFDVYLGPGTVGVGVAGPNISSVSQSIIDAAVQNINAKRPLGSTLYVFNVSTKAFDFTISVPVGTSVEIQNLIKNNLASLFADEAEPGGTILLSHISSAILSSGVSDFTITEILEDGESHPISNIVMTSTDIAKLGVVTINEV